MELAKIKQRLELLYQEVEKLEAEGGGGSGGDSYTKAQTDALLATKVDKVQGSSLMTTAQANKLEGIESGAEVNVQANWNETDTTSDAYILNKPTIPNMTNYYTKDEVDTSQGVQNTEIGSLVDRGAKNLLKITATSQTIKGVTFTVNDDGTVSVDGTNNASSSAVFYLDILPADTAPNYNGCRLTGCPQGGSASTYRLGVQLNSGSYTNYASDTGGGSTIRNVPSSECRVTIIVYAGVTVSNLIFKPMICIAEDYAISPEFAPYAPTNRELYETKADKSIVGLKLVASDTMASSLTYTYAMNKNDFIESSPDLGRSVGTYIISIMPWSTSPTYSLYAVSYTGGSFGYTAITKIAGDDRQITVENGVISVSGLPSAGGKISIHALL